MMKVTIRTSVFLRGETGGHKTTQAAAFQTRLGSEGARPLQNHLRVESAQLWKGRLCKIILSSYKKLFFKVLTAVPVPTVLFVQHYRLRTPNHFVPVHDSRDAWAMAMYELRRRMIHLPITVATAVVIHL